MIRQIRLTVRGILHLLAASALSLTACSEKDMAPILPEGPGQWQEVSLRIGQPVTRTAIDVDEGGSEAGQAVSLRWADGDKIALWAQGPTSFTNVLFTHGEHPDDPDGSLFTGTVPAMEEGGYTYYAVYPGDRVEAQGDALRIGLPAVQSGEYDPALDIMRAEAAGEPLLADNLNRTDLRFRHLTHVLKIRVPEVPFGDGRIARMCIEFPAAVAGTLVFADITDDTPVLEDGSDRIVLEFAEPKAAGDDIWAFIAPVDVTGAEVSFTATDGTDFTYPAVTSAFRNLAAGHITPVNVGFRVREMADGLFTVTVDKTNLGEEVTVLHAVSLPEGYVFPGLGTSDTAYAEDFTPLGEGKFGIRMYQDVLDRIEEAEGARATIRVESEHTVPQEWTSEMTEVSASGFTVASPYLFFEDFSGTGTFSRNDNDGTVTTAEELTENGLAGWTAARCGADEGVFRINCRTVYFLFSTTRYHGRADSRPMTGLKEDAAVKVRVSFSYSLGRGNNSLTPMMAYGYHTAGGPVNASTGNAAALADPVAKDVRSGSGNDGSWTNVNESASYEIEGCTPAHRLAWECYTTGSSSANCWLYIDDVKVSIVGDDD